MLKILISIIIFISIFLYIYYYKKNTPSDEIITFIPSQSFNGYKSGYVFKFDTLGLGYYLDTISA